MFVESLHAVGRVDDATSQTEALIAEGYATKATGKDLEAFLALCARLGLEVPPAEAELGGEPNGAAGAPPGR